MPTSSPSLHCHFYHLFFHTPISLINFRTIPFTAQFAKGQKIAFFVIPITQNFKRFSWSILLYLNRNSYSINHVPVLGAGDTILKLVVGPTHFITNQHTVPRKGLDPTILDSLPITVFRSKDFKEGLECVICLSELSEGEEARLLPVCNHGFHLECIDMWFHSNSTCPLCRYLVCNDSMQSEVPTSEVPPNFMENVMFWDPEDLVRPGVVGITNQDSSSPEGASSMNARECW